MADIKSYYKPFDRFIIRTPLLPLNSTENLNDENLYLNLNNNIVKESLFIASPVVFRELEKLESTEELQNNRKLKHSLLKYYSRMSHRCTPFGLFSGCTLGEFSDEDQIVLKHPKKHKKKTRLDMNYLCSLAQSLDSNKDLSKNNLLYYPNSSLYKIGGELRYVEYKYFNGERKHFTSSIDYTPYTEKVLKLAEQGAAIANLIEELLEPGISYSDAESYIIDLIDNQILVSSIHPTVTGDDYLKQIIEKSENVFGFDIISELERIDSTIGENNFSSRLNQIAKKLLEINPQANRKFLFQTDLKLSTKEKRLNASIIPNLLDGLSVLNKLSTKRFNSRLSEFKTAFLKRYETEEVPLNIALDVESGIGYGLLNTDYFDYSKLTDDLIFQRGKSNEQQKIRWNRIDEFILERYLKHLKDSSEHLYINEGDLNDLEEDWEQFPETFSLMLNILSFKSDELPLIRLDFAGNTSAGNLIARFGHMDSDIREYLEDIAEAEKSEDYITAEILHLPESRTGNILSRPRIRDYEIPYLAQSTLSPKNRIMLNDLYISIKNDRIILRSKRLNKIVRPILTNAHNYWHNSLPTYQFLCDLQGQDLHSALAFQWPSVLKNEKFLPRVIFKNFILSPARFNFKSKDFKDITNIEELTVWLHHNKIPDEFILKEGDNELYLDMKNPLFQDVLISEMRKKNNLIIEEYLFDEENSLVRNDCNPFTNEFLFAFKRKTK